jgi:hypothetical protein
MKRHLNFVQKSLKPVLDTGQRFEIKPQKRALGVIFFDMKAISEKEAYQIRRFGWKKPTCGYGLYGFGFTLIEVLQNRPEQEGSKSPTSKALCYKETGEKDSVRTDQAPYSIG